MEMRIIYLLRIDKLIFSGNRRPMTRAISLDFWGTVATPNPQYGAARKKFFSELFGIDEDEAHSRYLAVKRHCDSSAEAEGESITPLVAVKRVLADHQRTRTTNAAEVLLELEEIVRKHPPIIHPDIPGLIADLQSHHDVVIGVASNTNFIRGSLQDEHGHIGWDFCVYSDEIGVSKPDPDFFSTVVSEASRRCEERLSPDDVLHMGDNRVCDLGGASKAGLRALLVTDPDNTAAFLRNFTNIAAPAAA
jgi:putative hydrolase of the HAD superfamily